MTKIVYFLCQLFVRYVGKKGLVGVATIFWCVFRLLMTVHRAYISLIRNTTLDNTVLFSVKHGVIDVLCNVDFPWLQETYVRCQLIQQTVCTVCLRPVEIL